VFNLKHLNSGQKAHDMNFKLLDKLASMNNTIVLFTDDNGIKSHFAHLRRNNQDPVHSTDIILLSRKGLSTKHIQQNTRVKPKGRVQPKYMPGTVEEFYKYLKHWKYELLGWVLEIQMIQTQYLTWLDPMVYFDTLKKLQTCIRVPIAIKDEHVAFMKVNSFNPALNSKDVIQQNKVWISGNLFYGRPKNVWIFVLDYKKQLRDLMSQYGFISSDEQVLYTMFLNHLEHKPRVSIQTYTQDN